MQTFLPYADFNKSAKCLDNKRLGKQRLEVLQILRVLNGETKGWKHHPAVLMWNRYTEALIEYGCSICTEWVNRGFEDYLSYEICKYSWGEEVVMPSWIGDERFHSAHRSNLLRKYPEHYALFDWTESNDLPYFWPTKEIEYA